MGILGSKHEGFEEHYGFYSDKDTNKIATMQPIGIPIGLADPSKYPIYPTKGGIGSGIGWLPVVVLLAVLYFLFKGGK